MREEDRIESVLPVPFGGRAWWVLHVRPRCEKKVADAVTRRGGLSYLPLLTRKHRYGTRKRIYHVPLFRGYVFALLDPINTSWCRQNDQVANVLEVADQQPLVDQLRQLYQALAVGEVVEVLPFLQVGKRVRITYGPFKDLEGLVVRVKNSTRVVLQVEMIQQSVVFEADSELLEPGS
ncbi:MAG TPA: transcription termination/antitermination NusG family protein [Kiritimatiellia bacterium]|nr:transcription termination/antitermination NusG family protein [Kiritimatiellia bacterium]